MGSYLALNLGPHWVRIVSAFERENPSCHVEFIDTGTQHSYLDLLRSGELDMVASRLPLQQPDLTIGPVLSHEDRVLIIAEDDPLARQEAVCVDDFAEHAVVGQGAGMPSEMVDAFIPPVSPSGRRMRRVPPISFEEVRLRVACGELVHATVRSAVAYWSHPTTTSLPIRDLPPSQTALVWVSANRSPKVEAFAAAASRVLATTELASCQPAATIRSRAA